MRQQPLLTAVAVTAMLTSPVAMGLAARGASPSHKLSTGTSSTSAGTRYDAKARLTPQVKMPPLRPGEQRFTGVGADFLPADSRIVAPVTARGAFAIGEGNGLAKNFRKPGTRVTSRLSWYTNTLGRQLPDGSMIPSVPRQLAWVIVFHDVESGAIAGPAHHSPRPVPTDVRCNFYLILSAQDGNELDAFRYCSNGPDAPR